MNLPKHQGKGVESVLVCPGNIAKHFKGRDYLFSIYPKRHKGLARFRQSQLGERGMGGEIRNFLNEGGSPVGRPGHDCKLGRDRLHGHSRINPSLGEVGKSRSRSNTYPSSPLLETAKGLFALVQAVRVHLKSKPGCKFLNDHVSLPCPFLGSGCYTQ